MDMYIEKQKVRVLALLAGPEPFRVIGDFVGIPYYTKKPSGRGCTLVQRKMSKGRWLFENLEPENEGKDAGSNGGCDSDHLHCSSFKLSPCSAFSKHSLELFAGSSVCYGWNDAFYLRRRGFNDAYG